MNSHGPRDFRLYRPAAVLVIDLVKHTSCDKAIMQAVQEALRDIFARAAEQLNREDVFFNYTGDGYVCALVGETSSRLIDFINASLPALRKQISLHGQDFRAGVDFGLLHLSKNELTGGFEHFDTPGIIAARLEGAAKPGQVLASSTVHAVFGPHYPRMFSEDNNVVTTKDRQIEAYEILPVDYDEIHRFFTEYFFRRQEDTVSHPTERTRILLVDDDHVYRFIIGDMFKLAFQGYEIVVVDSGEAALRVFEPKQFAAVITDEVMPGMDGIELTRRLVNQDPDILIFMITVMQSDGIAARFLASGGFRFESKPTINLETLTSEVRWALASDAGVGFRMASDILSEDRGAFRWVVQQAAEAFRHIQSQMSQTKDVAHSLLRHKARQMVLDFIDTIQSGKDILLLTSILHTRLKRVLRLARVVGRVPIGEFQSYLVGFTSDLQKLNPSLELALDFFPTHGKTATVPYGTVITLIICELIDNAIAAVDKAGRVETMITELPSAGVLQLVVRDNGPGVPSEIQNSMYEEGISTRGPDRGLGLSLIREAVKLLDGEIQYEYSDGALFRISIPLTTS